MQPDLIPFRKWCVLNGIGVTKGYSLVSSGDLKIVKVGRKSFVTPDESKRFADNLPVYSKSNNPKNNG